MPVLRKRFFGLAQQAYAVRMILMKNRVKAVSVSFYDDFLTPFYLRKFMSVQDLFFGLISAVLPSCAFMACTRCAQAPTRLPRGFRQASMMLANTHKYSQILQHTHRDSLSHTGRCASLAPSEWGPVVEDYKPRGSATAQSSGQTHFFLRARVGCPD